ncbi:hypothetical protein GCM10009801_73820 [Streptomyces albiaxialis]|uniref:Secreted protein n=1 Tax=Streptomyces albiaxialis TaxID=329523 RepID=A0ABN2X0H5_9ACTN
MRTRAAALGAALLTVLATGAATASTAAAQQKGPAPRCETHTVTWYPGTAVAAVRYGQWDMHVLVCPDKAPEDWSTQSGIELNSTAANVGLTVSEESTLVTTSTGENAWNRYARYEGRFTTRVCTPKVGWPCFAPKTWKAWFTITVDKRTKKATTHLQGGKPPEFPHVLFRNP